jgi:hypothetical protein
MCLDCEPKIKSNYLKCVVCKQWNLEEILNNIYYCILFNSLKSSELKYNSIYMKILINIYENIKLNTVAKYY